MTAKAIFAIPGDLQTLTGGYGYDRRVLALSPELEHLALPGGFPFPSPEDVVRTIELLKTTRAGAPMLIDGLAFGALAARDIAALRRPTIALVHHPLGLETGLDSATSQRLIQNEKAALALADAVIVTSPVTAATLIADFAVPPTKITVAEPGADPAPRALGSSCTTLHMLAVGAIVPRKGFDVLIDSLELLKDRDWRLTIAGSAERAPDCAAALQIQIKASGLAQRVKLAGEMGPDVLAAVYARSDLFVLSSHYEGYGMVLAEAMARGLPIVMTRGGAAAQTVPDDAALKVSPGDARGMSLALARAMDDAPLRDRLADASWRAGQTLPRWEQTAETIRSVLARFPGSAT